MIEYDPKPLDGHPWVFRGGFQERKARLMKVICNRGALLEALTVAGSVVASRTPKPVLQCVKISAGENRLTIAATDLEVAIRYSDSQVQVEKEGETLVPADKFR